MRPSVWPGHRRLYEVRAALKRMFTRRHDCTAKRGPLRRAPAIGLALFATQQAAGNRCKIPCSININIVLAFLYSSPSRDVGIVSRRFFVCTFIVTA